jgi:hypothetical protein
MKLYLVYLFLITGSFALFGQSGDAVVAKIGNDNITAREFKLRFELSPYIPENQNLPSDSLKYDFLYSLIAEKIWASEAEKLGISNSEKFIFFFKPLEDLFVRDALFKVEVKDKVKLNQQDLIDGINKYPITIKALAIVDFDSTAIFNFYNQLKVNSNPDSLLNFYPQLSSNSEEVEIKLGALKDEELENLIFSLGTNEFNEPMKTENGWAFFFIKNKTYTVIDLNDQKTVDQIKDVLRNRRIEKRYQEYYKEILTGFNTEINPETFNIIFSDIWGRIKLKYSGNDTVKYYELNEADFISILNSPSYNNYANPLFSIRGKDIKAKDFLSDLAFNGFNVKQIDSSLVLFSLNQKLKNFIENQVITEVAYKRELQFTPDVRNDLTLWREKYLSQFYFNSTLDSIHISEEELFSYFQTEKQNKSNLTLINIRLITLNNLDLIAEILSKLNSGEDFGEVIKPFGQTDSLVNIFGETGLRPVISLGEMGQRAINLKMNEVYGPIQRNNSYTLLQVIEKKDQQDSLNLNFDLIKDQLRNDLRIKKLYQRLNNSTSFIALKNDVKIFPDAINNLSTTKIPMFVHRFMGFGGRVSGMPLLMPFSEWIKKMDKVNILP